jgi:hypothetical protein
MRKIPLLYVILTMTSTSVLGKVVVFFEKGFPSVDNGAISRITLEKAFGNMSVRFAGLTDIQNALGDTDLFVLPYGSAFPADMWKVIEHHINNGNFLVLGGRPLYVPVYHDGDGWRIGGPQNTFSRYIGVMYSYVVPQVSSSTGRQRSVANGLNNKPLQGDERIWKLEWDEDAPFFGKHPSINFLNPIRVFSNSGFGQRYRGVGFLIDSCGNRLAAPIVADDKFGLKPRRGVYLSFDADSAFWNSDSAIALIHAAAVYASFGADRIWIDLQSLALDPGEHVTGTVDVLHSDIACSSRGPAQLKLQLLAGDSVIETRTLLCENSLHDELNLKTPLIAPGLYRVRAILSAGDTIIDQYTSGVDVRDSLLLRSGEQLEAGRDYFRLGKKPYIPVGINYFSTDPYTSDFFVGGSLGGNAYVWERDFGEMERQGITIVRTGTWLNRFLYLDQVTGAADERLLRAIEAYLDAAARHHMQVIFTFFAFNPQIEMQQGPGQEGDRLGPGSNPYLDPVAVNSEIAYVRSIVSRFKDVPFLSYDLINEPSFANPKRIWKGNSPNGDPMELRAWHRWLEKRYSTIDSLAKEWRVAPSEFKSFDDVPEPTLSDFDLTRYGNPNTVRAVDYDLFAQDAFIQWADTIIEAIRSTGSKQIVTVGQDEGGVTDRVLTQFWANSKVDYTVDHTWWRDDALLWNSVVAKTVEKPNLIEETGPQPVWNMDGTWRWDDQGGLGLEERKLVLGLAAANAGVLHWDWTRSDDFGIMRRDGSQKVWMDALHGIAEFARKAQSYATGVRPPETAIVLPQSLQLSPFNTYALEAQQKAVRVLYQYVRSAAFAVGEYQISQMPAAKLIIVPSPWVLSQDAWDLLMERVRAGATLLISGRVDADDHWVPVPKRTNWWNVKYEPADLTTREVEVNFPGGTVHLSYSGDKTTYAQRGQLSNGKTFDEISLGKGEILYFTFPIELADQLDGIAKIYKYASEQAGVDPSYSTSCSDPGILICPTELYNGTLYVFTSESANSSPFEFHDNLSGKRFMVHLEPGRAGLMLVDKDGKVEASYNVGR